MHYPLYSYVKGLFPTWNHFWFETDDEPALTLPAKFDEGNIPAPLAAFPRLTDASALLTCFSPCPSSTLARCVGGRTWTQAWTSAAAADLRWSTGRHGSPSPPTPLNEIGSAEQTRTYDLCNHHSQLGDTFHVEECFIWHVCIGRFGSGEGDDDGQPSLRLSITAARQFTTMRKCVPYWHHNFIPAIAPAKGLKQGTLTCSCSGRHPPNEQPSWLQPHHTRAWGRNVRNYLPLWICSRANWKPISITFLVFLSYVQLIIDLQVLVHCRSDRRAFLWHGTSAQFIRWQELSFRCH